MVKVVEFYNNYELVNIEKVCKKYGYRVHDTSDHTVELSMLTFYPKDSDAPQVVFTQITGYYGIERFKIMPCYNNKSGIMSIESVQNAIRMCEALNGNVL